MANAAFLSRAAVLLVLGALPLLQPAAAVAEDVKPVQALAMHGAPKYAPGFDHFDYTNPDAPKGGEIHFAGSGTFDSLNPFIMKGVAAPGVEIIYQTLLTKSDDEAFTEYGQLAESVEMPEDRSYVVFNLNKSAKFSDGQPVTADDVVWTFNILITEGAPGYRAYYAGVKDVAAESPTRVKFRFKAVGNRELPLILGELPVLPKHFWQGKKFDTTPNVYPVGSGPYEIKSVDNGKRITYARVKNWWAKDLGVNKGKYNFDTIVGDVYRDETVLFQALFSGQYDYRFENVARNWFGEYEDKQPVKAGLIKREEIKNSLPMGMQAFAYNIRRPMFSDPRVRRALNYAFDFEWSNKQLAYGSYQRTSSYFENSDLASRGLPEGKEKEFLEQYRGKIPDEIFSTPYQNPQTNGSGNDLRANLQTAAKLLAEAGWKLGQDQLLQKDGQPFKFEVLLASPAYERWFAPFIGNLKKIGIQASIRHVDDAQYQRRMDDFDYDMTLWSFGESLSPGNEQRGYWGSTAADTKGSHNVIGIKNPVIDELVEKIVGADSAEDLQAYCRALDRILLFNYYVIPNWHLGAWRIAYWDKFGKPAKTAPYSLGVPDTWWFDKDKAAAVAAKAPQKDAAPADAAPDKKE